MTSVDLDALTLDEAIALRERLDRRIEAEPREPIDRTGQVITYMAARGWRFGGKGSAGWLASNGDRTIGVPAPTIDGSFEWRSVIQRLGLFDHATMVKVAAEVRAMPDTVCCQWCRTDRPLTELEPFNPAGNLACRDVKACMKRQDLADYVRESEGWLGAEACEMDGYTEDADGGERYWHCEQPRKDGSRWCAEHAADQDEASVPAGS